MPRELTVPPCVRSPPRSRITRDAGLSSIFGIVRRDGGPLDPADLHDLGRRLQGWNRDGLGEWADGAAGLGQARDFTTPEAEREELPSVEPGLVFTAAARLDNRDELFAELGLDRTTSPARADVDVVHAAYRRWGERAPLHLLGDWSLAAWHPAERRLFLARDQFGTASLHYVSSSGLFAFAPSFRAMVALAGPEAAVDELWLAHYLISWPMLDGSRTLCREVRRLPPAHLLTLTPERLEVRCYWRMEEVEPESPRPVSEYAEGLAERLDDAVRARLRCRKRVGATLSGGLDSGSVAVSAARLLRTDGASLRAFTSVPAAAAPHISPSRFGDELPFAQATAAHAGNIDLNPIPCPGASPIAAIRDTLRIHGQPVHGSANAYWMQEIDRSAAAAGCDVLLVGQHGNAGISWTGETSSQPLAYQLRALGAGGAAQAWLRRLAPRRLRAVRAHRLLGPEWYRASAIDPEFERRLDVAGLRNRDLTLFRRQPLERRFAILQPGYSHSGTLAGARSAAAGLDIRDPTADLRVLRFVLAVPDRIFIDRASGQDRWLIREAMRDRLPDRVRLNRTRGLQAADVVLRLRWFAEEVEAAIEEVAAGPASRYVDSDHLRQVWRRIQRDDTSEAYAQTVTVLTRGLTAGLHVNALAGGQLAAGATLPD